MAVTLAGTLFSARAWGNQHRSEFRDFIDSLHYELELDS